MHEDETSLCPFPERRDAVLSLASLCRVKIEPEEDIYRLAQDFLQRDQQFSARDAIHLAYAVYAEADFFLTCDDDLSKQAKRLLLNLKTMNPVEYIRRENQ